MIKIKWINAIGSNVHYVFEGTPHYGIDFSSGIFAANLGHWGIWGMDHNLILNTLPVYGVSIHAYHWDTEIKAEYRRRLLELTGFDEVLFFSDGTTAVEAAIRICEDVKGVFPRVIMDSFHGRSYGPARMCQRRDTFQIMRHKLPLMLEGYRGWDAHFWDQDGEDFIHAIDDAPFLIFDEIQSGFYRTGKLFAYQWYPIRKPDLVIIGKGMGNGFPMSGILVRSKDLLPIGWEDEFSSTHGGNPLAMAFGLAALDGYESLNMDDVIEKGLLLHHTIEESQGRGMVAAILMPEARATEVFKECLRRGLFCVHTGKDSLKIGPPLTISTEDLERGLGILNEVLKDTP